jgi:hypothetical protein
LKHLEVEQHGSGEDLTFEVAIVTGESRDQLMVGSRELSKSVVLLGNDSSRIIDSKVDQRN